MNIEEIKTKWDWVQLSEEEIDWLVEQAEKTDNLEKEIMEIKGQKDFWLRNYSLNVSQHNKEIEGIRKQLTIINDQLLKLIK